MSDYRMTKEQRAYLDSLVCQRISKNQLNKPSISKFVNYRKPHLANPLKNGWNEDKKDKTAIYIVKEPGAGGMPLLFFSLRCGEVTIPLQPEKLRTALENSEYLLDAANGLDAPQWALDVVEKRKVNGTLPYHKLMEFRSRYKRNLESWKDYSREIRVEGDNIIRTKKSMAGVELVHFCVHTPAWDKWNALGLNRRGIGRTLFWKFVVPIIQQIRTLVGCEYLYLFAADDKKQGHLVRYYKEMGFEVRDDLSVTKPEYDFGCFFMCQKVTSLRNRQNEFFRCFNNPVDPAKQEQ